MTLSERVDRDCLIDANIVQANVKPVRRDKPHVFLAAVRKGDRVYVRNVYCEPHGMVVDKMAKVYYQVHRPHNPTPPKRSVAIGVVKLIKAGFRMHRNFFRVDREMRGLVIDTNEADFNTWWARKYYPGCDHKGYLSRTRTRSAKEILIRKYYEAHGTRWSPYKIRALARSYGTDLESLCAAIRLPLYIFGWFEDVFHNAGGNQLDSRTKDLMAPSFLMLDLLKGMKAGNVSTVFFPLNELRAAQPPPAPTPDTP